MSYFTVLVPNCDLVFLRYKRDDDLLLRSEAVAE